MTTLLARGMAMLDRGLATAGGEVVTLARGATSASVVAVPTSPRMETVDASGVAVSYGNRDFLIAAVNYAPAGVAAVPQRGDRITQTVGGVAEVYEVLAPPNGAEYQREARDTRYRVHTKRIS